MGIYEVKNLDFIVEQAGDTYAVYVFGLNIGFTTKYDEIDGIIEEFCQEWNIDLDSCEVNYNF